MDPIESARAATREPTPAGAAKLAAAGKLPVRERVALLYDEGTFVEDGQLASALTDGLPADGVVTGRGLVQGRPALVVANDPTVKAGSWGARTVEKIIRVTEVALRDELPWVYETSLVVYRESGAIAVHVHDRGGLPGLVGPLDGPPMDRVDWQEPGGNRLRFHVHTLPGSTSSEVTVKVAPPEGRSTSAGVAGLGGLDAEVRSSLAALRKHLERSR